MTDKRFDDLTRSLATLTTRRTILKGVVASALGGAVLRWRTDAHDVEARARVKMACARLGQACDSAPHAPGNLVCCPHLACDADLTCCKPTNESCADDGDCCAGDVCRPNPRGIGDRCLPPGDLGAECVEDDDCAGSLICAESTGACLIADGDPCVDDRDCASGLCDEYSGSCVGDCLADGLGCAESSDCCSGFCDPYTLTCLATAEDGAPCFEDAQCASNYCTSAGICATVVSPNSMDGWIVTTRGPEPTVTFVSGVGTPPLGDGSVEFVIGSDGNDEARLSTTLFTGALLSDFTKITYWAYVDNNLDSQAPYLRLQLDRDGDGLVQDQLFFEPAYQSTGYIKGSMPDQGTITLDTWQQWNALDGCWWSNNGYAGLNPGSNCNSIAVYLASFPNAKIIVDDTIGSFRIDAGNGGVWANFVGYVDDLEVTVGGVSWVFDFEPTP